MLAKGKDGRDYVIAGQKSGIALCGRSRYRPARLEDAGRAAASVVGGIHFGMAAAGGRLFVPVTDVTDGKTYAIALQPGLHALDIATGRDRVESAVAGHLRKQAAMSPGLSGRGHVDVGELVLAGANDGYIRISTPTTASRCGRPTRCSDLDTVNGVRRAWRRDRRRRRRRCVYKGR